MCYDRLNKEVALLAKSKKRNRGLIVLILLLVPLLIAAGYVIASGGAGKPEHLEELFKTTQAQAAIISSMLYSPRLARNYSVIELKDFLSARGVNVRV